MRVFVAGASGALGSRLVGLERLPVGMLMHVELLPVVHAGPAQMPVADLESQGMNEVQPRAGDGAHATDVAGVLRDLRLEEHDVQHAREVARSRRKIKALAVTCP